MATINLNEIWLGYDGRFQRYEQDLCDAVVGHQKSKGDIDEYDVDDYLETVLQEALEDFEDGLRRALETVSAQLVEQIEADEDEEEEDEGA